MVTTVEGLIVKICEGRFSLSFSLVDPLFMTQKWYAVAN
uniref:Uncharacterized protein n=1 Tax=Arundo donax TaxID=35708 RepID=A0A0A8Y2E5_ARUDO